MDIQRVEHSITGLNDLISDAAEEQCDFIIRLSNEWASGENRYNAPGEILLACVEGGQIVGVGGLNQDPYVDDAGIGRMRHIYVRPNWRRQGVARTLVSALLDEARKSFWRVRLRAQNPIAIRLYQQFGFLPDALNDETYVLDF